MEDQTQQESQETSTGSPSEITKSEEQVTTEGTPTQVSPEAQPVEKTSEQVKDDRAYFQTELAQTKAELRALQVTEAAPTVAPQAQAQSQMNSLSQEEWNQKLLDEPLLAIQALSQQSSDQIEARFTQMERKFEVAAQSKEANKVVKEFCVRHDIAPKYLAEAHTKIKDEGWQGSPSQMASLALEFAQSYKQRDGGILATTQIAADVAETIKTQQLTVQPNTGSPTTTQPRTAQEGIASKFRIGREGNNLAAVQKGLF